MKYNSLLVVLSLVISLFANSQTYTSYFTGNTTDSIALPSGGVCLMGGATEDDGAMNWFLEQANGGDILVLRASGSDGYNNYFYSGLTASVNSVETIVFNGTIAASDSYIHQRIEQAEAIWFAGGDQWDYISYWRNTAIDSLINEAIATRNIVVGGTSAGMAILGDFYFSAQNGTVTSPTALSDPFDTNVTVDSLHFIEANYLSDVISDTHYDNPDRKGRHVVFLSRILADYGIPAKGIGCDEYTAVCIDNNGIASVYGQYPSYDDNAYFIQTNCELTDVQPENCLPGAPLDWNLGNSALLVYKVKGTSNGANTFDLNDWNSGLGGTWEHWYVENGVLFEQAGSQPICPLNSLIENYSHAYQLSPNPAKGYINITTDIKTPFTGTLLNINGTQLVRFQCDQSFYQLDLKDYMPGVYFIEINGTSSKVVIQ